MNDRQKAADFRRRFNEAWVHIERLRGQAADPSITASRKRELDREAVRLSDEAEELRAQAERWEAIANAKTAIPPLHVSDGGDGDEPGGTWGAIARGQLRHETTYRPDRPEASYVRDLLAVSMPGTHDPRLVSAAQDRLRTNQIEAEAFHRLHQRDVTTGDPGAASLIPPIYLANEWIDAAVGGRPLADAVGSFPYSEAGKSILFPRVTTAPEAEVQAAEADPVNEQDLDTDTLEVPKVTIAGQNDTSIQSLDWSLPGLDTVIMRELKKSYNMKLDYQLMYGTGPTGKQHRGLKTVVTSDSGIALSFSSGDGAALLGKLYEAVSEVSTQAPGYVPTGVVLHPRRGAWMASHRDENSNLLQQGSLPNAAGTQNSGTAGTIAGLQVIVDPNVLTNQGSGTNEDDVYVLDLSECLLAESAPRARVLQEVLSGTLQVRIQLYAYSAFAGGRRPKVICRISGAGLATPSFPST